jgi:hypothetical protein
VAKAPVSSWAVTFGYYTVITTKNTLLFFFMTACYEQVMLEIGTSKGLFEKTGHSSLV